MTDTRTDDANYAFSDAQAAKAKLQDFFERCSCFVNDELVTDVIDIGFIARMLEQITVELGANPAACQEGFREARNGDWVPDEFFSESLGRVVKFSEVWPPEDEGRLPSSTDQSGAQEAWSQCIEGELARLDATADDVEAALAEATANDGSGAH